MSDEDLIALAKDELRQLGLVSEAGNITGGYVVRQENLPVYAGDYREAVSTIRDNFISTIRTCIASDVTGCTNTTIRTTP